MHKSAFNGADGAHSDTDVKKKESMNSSSKIVAITADIDAIMRRQD